MPWKDLDVQRLRGKKALCFDIATVCSHTFGHGKGVRTERMWRSALSNP